MAYIPSASNRAWQRHWKRVLILLPLWLALAPTARAEKAPVLKPEGYVNDFAHVLSPEVSRQLSSLCLEVDQKAHAQIAVVTVRSLDGEPIDMFANDLFTKWGVGAKGTDRGVMILLAPADRHYRIEVGYGLEPILTDGLVGRFGREVVPALKAGNYSGAVLQLTRDVAGTIAQSTGVKLDSSLADAVPRIQHHGASADAPLIIFLIILGVG
ncbi:MAG: TPM domain-containing protein, partial [Terriglobia bacterium]